MEYESNGGRNKTLSIKEYLDEIKQYLKEIINIFKNLMENSSNNNNYFYFFLRH